VPDQCDLLVDKSMSIICQSVAPRSEFE